MHGFKHTNLLMCPSCQNRELVFTNDNISCPGCSSVFKIENSVAIMFGKNKAEPQNSEFHKTFGSDFDYTGHYQKDAFEFDYFQKRSGATGHNERRVREYILSKLPAEKGLILDVGCGGGWVAANLCPKGYDVVSFDISPKNTQEALSRYPFETHSAVAGDVFAIPFSPGSFDTIIASEIIEHVAAPRQFIQNLFKVLKPRGTLIVTTPYKEKIVYSLCVHCNKPTPQSAHLHSFDEEKLLSLSPEAGVGKTEYNKFANKALIYLHTHVFLRWMGFKCWKFTDRLANIFYDRPISILVKWEKNQTSG